ncbi:hypothetical protein Tco_1021607 [Tanacetum coccineum]
MKGECQRWMPSGIGEFPFTYLGLPIGENMRRVNAWGHVVEKFKIRDGSLNIGSLSEKKFEFIKEMVVLFERRGVAKFKGISNEELGRELMERGWVDDQRLCDRFPKLFHLDSKKRVVQMEWKLGEDDEVTIKELAILIEEKVLRMEGGVTRRFGIIWCLRKLTLSCGGV